MRAKRAKIDSLNLSSSFMESIFIHNQDYTIEIVKSKSIFEPKEWSKTFGKALTKNIIEAKIIHSYLGLTIPLKTFAVTPRLQTIEFAGLQGYNERSKLLLQTLKELRGQLQYTRVTRIDIAIDFKGNIPKSIIKALSKHREPFRYGNTTYYKTAKEKKSNSYLDIKIYNKQHQAKLDFKVMRLEFVFKAKYLENLLFKDINIVYAKIEKTIKKVSNLSVKIEPIFPL